jgi:hypothetical protein
MEEKPPALNGIKDKLSALTYAHALWRVHFFKATGYTPPLKSIFGDEMDALFASDKQNINLMPPSQTKSESIQEHTDKTNFHDSNMEGKARRGKVGKRHVTGKQGRGRSQGKVLKKYKKDEL